MVKLIEHQAELLEDQYNLFFYNFPLFAKFAINTLKTNKYFDDKNQNPKLR